MELQQVKTAIKATPKGCNIVLEWTRPCKTRKGVQDTLTKHVRMVGRMGVEYDNLNEVQEKREGGDLPAVNAGLKWGTWLEYPFLIQHNGKVYLRLYFGTSQTTFPKVSFFRNGVEVEKETIAPLLLASELTEKEGDCFTCSIENLERLNHEEIGGEVKQVTEATKPAKEPVTA